MDAQEFARLHPRLYHVTNPFAWDLITRIGLLSSSALLETFEYSPADHANLATRRRATEVEIHHPKFGIARLNDNRPLSEVKLAKCLDDGISPSEWLKELNARVFFWPDRKSLSPFLEAKAHRHRPRQILVFDTLALVSAHFERAEISPINSGSTIYDPARRGHATFTPLGAMSYLDWRKKRGKQRDVIKEVTVRGGIPDAARYLISRKSTGP